MRWKHLGRSKNVEDHRGGAGRKAAAFGGGSILLVLIAWLFGLNPQTLLNFSSVVSQNSGTQASAKDAGNFENDEVGKFMSAVLRSTEVVWQEIFRQHRREYREPKLVRFAGQVHSACGHANAAVGPFYCGANEKLYLDTQFFDEMRQKMNAPGDFARAYVIAHEVGHHVQKLLGTLQSVQSKRRTVSETEYNKLQVRLELQADFYAGIWAHHAQKQFQFLEKGDLKEAIGAAHAVGDDTLQKKARGYVVPDSFTHGTSEQRIRWFIKGFESGRLEDGDTFRARKL